MRIVLPFPPSILSGHANGNGRWKKIAETKRFRALGKDAVEAAGGMELPTTGDVKIHLHFIPPDNRSDRTNAWNRCKGIIDGIEDGLKIDNPKFNDRRFLPSMSFGDPEKPGCVIVTIGG